MKQAQFTLNNKELLLVELPEGAESLNRVKEFETWAYQIGHTGFRRTNVPKDYNLIGKLPEVSEEEFSKLVFRSRIGKYQDYTYDIKNAKKLDPVGLLNVLLQMSKDTAKESFFSKLEAEGVLFENPFGKEPCQREDRFITVSGLCRTDMWKKELVRWQSAQEKVFNIDNTYLFEKV